MMILTIILWRFLNDNYHTDDNQLIKRVEKYLTMRITKNTLKDLQDLWSKDCDNIISYRQLHKHVQDGMR